MLIVEGIPVAVKLKVSAVSSSSKLPDTSRLYAASSAVLTSA